MNSNKFYTGIVIRVTIIATTSLALSYFFLKTNYIYTILVLILLLSVLSWNLVRYIMRQRNDIRRMLEHIKENNPSIYFSQKRDYPFGELGDFLNEIGDIVREVRIDKESQLQYMNYIVRHVGTGLLSFDPDGNIEIINQAAKDLLGVTEIKSINQLEYVSSGLPAVLMNIRSGEKKVIILKTQDKLIHLSVHASVFKIGNREIRLMSIQDIKHEMDEKEMDAWQKLIRVLTHEIINSVTPVTALTSTISGYLKKNDAKVSAADLSDEDIAEALTGLGYIEERGKSLIDFVNRFRSLTKLPVPKFEEVNVAALIEGISLLKKDELKRLGIDLECNLPPVNLQIQCDRGLIEHVLINLINNASDAILAKKTGDNGIIEIGAKPDDDHTAEIFVRDNGTGIPDDLIDNIFIPFFTTKENGSGIGLSLSRQILKLHGGTISAFSRPGKGTVFQLKF
jgi:two-component system nitrogen regulation sensor histidine kinase NtrY